MKSCLATLKTKHREWLPGAFLSLLFLAVCIPQVKVQANSWNDYSHAAAIESLAARGTWVINGSRWTEDTGDKIKIGNRFYSDKLPLLSFVGAGLYSVLHRLGGLWLIPDCWDTGQPCAYPWLVLILVTLPADALVWLFYAMLIQNGIGRGVSALCTCALAFGTMILPYSLVLNHHIPAAVSLFAGFFLLNAAKRTPSRQTLALVSAGLFSALGASLDISSSVWWFGLFAIALYYFRRRALWFLLGSIFPFGATALLDYQMLGTIVPPSFIPNAYDYAGASFPNTLGGVEAPDNLARYAFDMLIGARGLYVFNPILLFAVAALLMVALRRAHPLWFDALAVTFSFALVSWLLVSRTNHFGGIAYGERLYIPSIPLVFAFIGFGVPFIKTHGQNVWRFLFALALGLSVISVAQGLAKPWGQVVPPPLQLTAQSEFPWLGTQWNLLAVTPEPP